MWRGSVENEVDRPTGQLADSFSHSLSGGRDLGSELLHTRTFAKALGVKDPSADIAVEKIHEPILLDCGTDDEIWAACAYAQAIQHRLAAAHDRFPHVLYRYRGAGHFVNQLNPFEPGTVATAKAEDGNSDAPLANENADARLWPHVLSFLANPIRQTGTFAAPATPPRHTP
jgi:hypothetical protein